jgi:serine/threonine protein kinase
MTNPLPFGKFLLLDRLNAGGMAEVFLAKVFGRQGGEGIVALKRILPSLLSDQEFVGMFIDEARIAVQLDHRNLVQIFELGRHADNYYIAMEYVSGFDLRTVIDRSKKRRQPLSIAQVIHLVGELASGLDHAHRARDRDGKSLQIVHRDVSPQNIVLSRSGRLKLIDFGIAKAATRLQATQAGILKGKFGYMSPEQARGLPIDRRSDLFAMGVIFYELLTGLRLFAGEADFAVLERVRKAEIAPPRRANPAIPEEIERIVLKALAREPEDRYGWASEMIDDLRSFSGFEDAEQNAEIMANWLRLVLAEELDRQDQRMRVFDGISRPPEVAMVALEDFMVSRRSPTTGENPTQILPDGGLAQDFELARTSLMTSLPTHLPANVATSAAEGFSSAPSETDVGDRWEASTRSPLPVSTWAPVTRPEPLLFRPAAFDRPRPASAAPRRTLAWAVLVLFLSGPLVIAAVWAERSFSTTGTLIVNAHSASGLLVEVDNQPVPLSNQGIGVIRKMKPGSHFLLAKGAVEHQARWVTVLANEVTTIDLVLPASSQPLAPPAPEMAHNRDLPPAESPGGTQ